MKILLIDDHVMFREGLVLLLRPIVGDARIEEAGSCEEALAKIQSDGVPDLVLMDLGLPGMSGIDGMSQLRERHPGLPMVALSSSEDRQTVLRAIEAGSMGFIPKSSSSSILAGALKLILAGGIYLPPAAFLDRMPAAQPALVAPATSPKDLGLTTRQADVLYLILQGKSTKLICRELDLSLGTVKAHTSSVLRALNVTTRTQAVLAASRLGLVFDAKR